MTQYSVQPKDIIFLKGYGLLSFSKVRVKIFVKI